MISLSCRPQEPPSKRRRTVPAATRQVGGFSDMLHEYLSEQKWIQAPHGRDNKYVVFTMMPGEDGYCFWRSLNACQLLLEIAVEWPADKTRRVKYNGALSILFDILHPAAIWPAAPLKSSCSCPYIIFVFRKCDSHWSVVVQQSTRTYYINESRQYCKTGQHASELVQFFADHSDLEHQMLHFHLHQ